jgi:hypothetical protein
MLSAYRWARLYMAWQFFRRAVRWLWDPSKRRFAWVYCRIAFGHLREFVTLAHKEGR